MTQKLSGAYPPTPNSTASVRANKAPFPSHLSKKVGSITITSFVSLLGLVLGAAETSTLGGGHVTFLSFTTVTPGSRRHPYRH